MQARPLLLAALALLVAGGAHAQSQKVKRDRNRISAEELAAESLGNAYEAVERLRPDWFRRSDRPISVGARRPGGRDSVYEALGAGPSQDPPKLAVLVDETEVGGVEALRGISSELVAELRYLSGSDAQQRYGSRFGAGVIVVVLKPGQ